MAAVQVRMHQTTGLWILSGASEKLFLVDSRAGANGQERVLRKSCWLTVLPILRLSL